ncbi:hypothetical protein Nepgr_022666 [Nepenthes gracilis]|uniref:Uncharacterized protein n=1 Tax=Nepenthes gracilis TaxID=150966 RepID=A0AAD3T1F7_NEPGR|nr:hypothetical protein Nepgr_022666 [Nepenthes gracilis]
MFSISNNIQRSKKETEGKLFFPAIFSFFNMYQMVSPDSLPSGSSCVSNSSLKENNGTENGRIPTSCEDSSFQGNGLMHTSPSKSQQYNHHNNLCYFTSNIPNNTPHTSQLNNGNPAKNNHSTESGHHLSTTSFPSGGGAVGGCGGADVLLQWGQRKRSRCSRTEARSGAEKHPINHMVPPLPPPPLTNGRGAAKLRPNGVICGKDTFSDFLPSKNRAFEDQVGASPSSNGSSRAIPNSRSMIGKRSHSSMEKNDKKMSSIGSIRKEKSDSSNHVGKNGAPHLTLPPPPPPPPPPVGEGEKGNGGEAIEWPRIYISLSRKEKEDDFYAMKGTKLPHRPKKRAKAIDRTLQYCFPGLWLTDLSRARYEVRERKSAKKQKRRGLKGLESCMGSDSE